MLIANNKPTRPRSARLQETRRRTDSHEDTRACRETSTASCLALDIYVAVENYSAVAVETPIEATDRAPHLRRRRVVGCSGSGGAGAEGVGDLEAGVGHPGVVGAGEVLPIGGGGDAVVEPADVRDVVAADLVAPDPRDQHRPLLERVGVLHVLLRRSRGRYRLLLGRDRDGARRGAQLGEARRGHEQREEQS